jgi:hypothetical protein
VSAERRGAPCEFWSVDVQRPVTGPSKGSEGIGFSELLGLGFGAAVTIAVGIGLGWLVDSLVGTFPLFLFIGLALGVVGAVSFAVVEFRKFLN